MRDIDEQSTIHRTVPTAENSPALNISNAEAETPCSEQSHVTTSFLTGSGVILTYDIFRKSYAFSIGVGMSLSLKFFVQH